MKSQIETPIYTVVFLAVMVGTLLIMEDVIKEWNSKMELFSEANRLVGYGSLISIFSNYSFEYPSHSTINITIKDDEIIVEDGKNSVVLENACHFEDNVINNARIIKITKSNNRLIVDGK